MRWNPTNKFNAKITIVDGFKFASKKEAERYKQLKLMQSAGQIREFKRQVSFKISRKKSYRVDFLVTGKNGEIWAEDVKGKKTDLFLLKQDLFEERYPEIPLKII